MSDENREQIFWVFKSSNLSFSCVVVILVTLWDPCAVSCHVRPNSHWYYCWHTLKQPYACFEIVGLWNTHQQILILWVVIKIKIMTINKYKQVKLSQPFKVSLSFNLILNMNQAQTYFIHISNKFKIIHKLLN